jgi:hypothetical protein
MGCRKGGTKNSEKKNSEKFKGNWWGFRQGWGMVKHGGVRRKGWGEREKGKQKNSEKFTENWWGFRQGWGM